MSRLSLHRLLLAGSLAMLAATAIAAPRTVTDPQAPRALQAEGPVSVQWNDPRTFTELRNSPNRFEAERGDWVQQLAKQFRSAATKTLQPGQTLDITMVDIKRAGDFEPWHGPRANDIRILRDIYPPRIQFEYTLKGGDGQVLDQGEATLRDSGFLHGGTGRQGDSDPLRYEKKLIDDWVRRDLAKQIAAN
ncbi:DUF3016 domain-containing protein [Stenotrophomonas tumulicola]|uniref:DUF3016 domain-containing protein n=1 Tax=Stenotrophomonas tumulicola TaxID=1685415 RepID=A0A7W3IIJ5_9GAMM|nr:DUF3016 domain-containing protein [Stenotrophomonas tumulicola]MBA8683165.1 DUF3016 domain-containing protein [Stenotrophomonas tumulicola]